MLLIALATAVAFTVPAGADPALQVSGDRAPYVVIMDDDPVVAYEGDVPGLAATKPARGRKVNPNSAAVKNYQKHLDNQRGKASAAAGVADSRIVNTYHFTLAGFSALLTPAEAERLQNQKGVISVVRDELRQLHTDASGDFLGLTDAGGAYDSDIDGEGVVVGIIDTGIWPEHPSFADTGSLPDPPVSIDDVDVDPGPDVEILLGCNFGDTAHNPDDLAFECNDKLIGARDMRTLYNALIGPELYNSARDADGHGSHTASTAAGNAEVPAEIFGIERGTVTGIANRAHVVAYKGCGDLGCFVGDLADAIDQAVADGVDVINYSIGSLTPGLTGPDDIGFLFAAAVGVHVATSNGNSGPGAGTVGSPASVPWLTSVGASHHDRMFQGSVVLGDGSEIFGASVTAGVDTADLVDAADLRNELCSPDTRFTPPPRGKIVLCKGAVGRAAKSRAVLEQGGVGMILYNDVAHQTLPSDNHFVPTVHVTNADGLDIKAYIDSVVPGRGGGKAIGVRAEAEIMGGEAVEREGGTFMAFFSSRGPVGSPASSDIIKPDVTAPGVQILAANSPAEGFDAPGQLFQAIQGTSMSSPHGAGLLALLKQAHPTWSPAAVKSALMTSARQDVFKEDQTTPADPFDMGAGHVDPSGSTGAPGSAFNPGIVYDAGFNQYVGFLCDAAPEIVSPAFCAALEGAGIPTTTENLNYPSIGASEVPGTLTVQRTVTNVSGAALNLSAVVEEPSGFDVTVTPSDLSLASGASATFEVTFDNLSAPLGEWRFGSLTWEGDGYSARSPIAVAAAQLDAPDSVTGTGVEGSVSFEITFGYSGEYDATAHGLVPDVNVTGSVGQDEDQTFDPNDSEGTTTHEIVLSGTAAWKLTLGAADLDPANEDFDIDLYLFKDGQAVAASTNPGTDEEIILRLPENGTYTLFVHGWQTLGTEVGYTLHTWDVPNTADAGSLEITAEPDDAVIGTTGTITVEWSGLDTGTNYLGAVAHSDEDGIFGLTLVEVSTE
ncbi:MAG TPA: S8 family peptidase [Acidimicrobiia bacterium]|nr:S8 family peptidase [Acidimicrobiia bacterium]